VTSPETNEPDVLPNDGAASEPPTEAEQAEREQDAKDAKRDLRDKAVRAAGWTIVAGLLARVLGVLGSLGITYFLDPAAIGDVQLAVILAFTANQFTLLGYGQYLVAKPNEGADTVFHVTVLHISLGIVAFAITLVLGIPLSSFFHAPLLMKYLPWMLAAAMLERLYFVPERVLVRELDFPRVAVARSLSELTYSISSVGFAFAGFGGMAILLGNVARGLVRLAITWHFVPRKAWLTPTPLRKDVYKRILKFGLPLGASQALAFANTRFDNLLMKRLFGSDVMGRYTLAYNLADVPAEQIGEQIAEVLLPSFARMTPADRKTAIVRVTGIIALVIFPIAVGFGAVALTAERLMRPEWHGIGAMLMVLCVMSITRPLISKAHSYLQATDRTIRITQLEAFKLVAVIGCIYGFSRFGPLWSCFGVGVAFLMELSLSWFIMSRGDGIPFTAFFAKLVPPLMACVPMVVAVELTRRVMLDLPVLLSLLVQVLVGAIAYGVGALVLARSHANEFLTLTRSALERRRDKKKDAPEAA
jgi:lipopolysaccharide exporter